MCANQYSIGIDFDNTLIDYSDVMYNTAMQFRLIDSNTKKNKKNIRDKIRRLTDGEIEWQKVQAYVYGKAINQAHLINGVKEFFNFCKNGSIGLAIISHKTQFAAQDTESIDLREKALQWMENHHFFDTQGLGLSKKQVYFESTREGKINRIRELGCAYFIDDLEETFFEESFPSNVIKILYDAYGEKDAVQNCIICRSWEEITQYISRVGDYATKEQSCSG